jgi:hypothetical protein
MHALRLLSCENFLTCAFARTTLDNLNTALDTLINSDADAQAIAALSHQINYAESWIAANCN